jgi:hypothetical protein
MSFVRGKWMYDREDKSTWKYKGFTIDNDYSPNNIRWIKNPDFAYEHLSPYGNEINWNMLEGGKRYAFKKRKK